MLAHYSAGSPHAPLVVLVHGVTDAATSWAELITHLAPTRHVVAIDMLGHGLSPRYTAATLQSPGDAGAAAFEETLDYLVAAHGTAVLIGHSMGGSIVASVASKRPELVAGLILEDPAWLSSEQTTAYHTHTQEYLSYAQRVWRADPEQTIAQNVAERGLRAPGIERPGADGTRGWSVPDHTGWAFGKGLTDLALIENGSVAVLQPWQEIARSLAIPTVVITSDGPDIVIGKRGAKEIAELGNQLITIEWIPGVGHNVRRSAPQKYEKIVDRCLAQWQP